MTNKYNKQKYTCLCCGYKTLTEPSPGTYAICPICGWEDDTADGGSNKVSLKQAKENFKKFGTSDLENNTKTRKPMDKDERDSDWENLNYPNSKSSSGVKKSLLGVLILLLILVAGVFVRQNRVTSPQATPVPSLIEDIPLENGSFLIKSTVTQSINGQEKVLFAGSGVDSVTHVRLGPDGSTLHFKTTIGDNRCAHLNTKDTKHFYPDTTPKPPPWTYFDIGNYPAIASCTEYISSGYLQNSDNFSYLMINQSRVGYLVVENLHNEQVTKLSIDPQLLAGFIAASDDPTHFGQVVGITGTDNSTYYYPAKDSYEVNGKFLEAFGPLILGVDTVNKKLMGAVNLTEPNFNVIADAFTVESVQYQPLAVINAGWETVEQLQAVIDYSGNELKVMNLTGIISATHNIFDTEKIEWVNNGVKLHFPIIQDLDIPKTIDLDNLNKSENESLRKQEEEKLTAQFLRSGLYQKVKCELGYGMLTPTCWGLISENVYIYKPGISLQKI